MKILIIGGNRFFGRHLAKRLLRNDHKLTLLNRGKLDDGLGDRVERITADRKNKQQVDSAVKGKVWDLVFDQVCYTAEDARIACSAFEQRAGRYVVTSSESIYDSGSDQREGDFDPKSYKFSTDARSDENYQEAKRQVEVVFANSKIKNLAVVRPSLVVGHDDYTGRLKWHLERIANGSPIYFPNFGIESDFIRSDQAALAMEAIGFSSQQGAVNCTAPDSLSMSTFIEICESAVGKKSVLASKEEGANHSPYGGLKTKTMDTSLLSSLGATIEPSRHWMPTLINEMAAKLNER